MDVIKENTIIIVPCYNAESSIIETISQILQTGFDKIIVGDDCSGDRTVEIVKSEYPNIPILVQKKNLGYGGNQKALYSYAITKNYKYVVMIHGDNQYTPFLIPSMVTMLHYAKYNFVFGSRITGGRALKGGMPLYKYFFNRILSLIQNIATGYKLSEYHSGLRAYCCSDLSKLEFQNFSDDFIFDNQIILGLIELKVRIGEVSCETVYDHQSSSISLKRSIIYGIGVVKETFLFIFKKRFISSLL